jgi:hypothetical protein
MVRTVAHHSPELNEAEAADAEGVLAHDPNDLPARVDLIEYYFGRSVSSPAGARFEEKREQHVLWLIAHHPDYEYAGTPLAWISPDQPHYAEAKALWLQKVASFGNNVAVLSNASAALSFEAQTSRELANRALALRPNDPKLHELLANSFEREMRHADSTQQRQPAAKKALEAWEAYEAIEPSQNERYRHYLNLANTAYEADDLPKAKRYATELLAHPKLEVGTNEPNGDEIHVGNTVLGRVALRNGDIEEAKRRLHASASTKGSPVLDSFGPRMSLAAELLDRNEKDAVVSYLHECSRFWQYGGDELKQWESDIRAGRKPNFGDNLRP